MTSQVNEKNISVIEAEATRWDCRCGEGKDIPRDQKCQNCDDAYELNSEALKEKPDEEETECSVCGGELTPCQHVPEGVCFCDEDENDTNHVFLRGKCIFCLFDGSKKFEDEWDCLWEVLDGIALHTYKLGLAQGKERRSLFPLSEAVRKSKKIWNELVPLYALYKAGHDAGMNI